MIERMIVAAVLVMLTLPVLAVTVVTPETSLSSDELAVIAVEDDWVRAEVDQDEATLRRVIDDQFVFNGNDGQLSGKEDLIEGILGGSMTGQTITERSVMVNGDTATIFGTAELHFAPPGAAESVSLLRYTSVYVKRDGRWRAIAVHMARHTPG